jgi:colanic acid/amylovoran biosynthesis glycosyltransferase
VNVKALETKNAPRSPTGAYRENPVPGNRASADREPAHAAAEASAPQGAPEASEPRAPSQLQVAYLVNQYPQPSQSFIRREIRALEELGYAVRRYSVRRWEGRLADDDDCAEQERTVVLLDAGRLGICLATLMAACRTPLRFVAAAAAAFRMGRRSDRGVLRHFVYLLEACLLARELRRHGVDHVHAHFGTNSTTVALLCRRLGGPPYSFTVHGPEEFDKPEFLHLGEKIRHAAFVVAISQFGRSQLFRQCEYADWEKVKIVRCGVDASFHDVEPTDPPAVPRLVCVARLHEQKGLPILIDAAGRLRDQGLAFRVKVIGDGPLRSELERRIVELKLEACIELAGWQSGPDVRAALLDSRGLVLPSFAEGLPVVIMESLALARPVISTYVAGIPELVDESVGRLVPAGSVAPLAQAMAEILTAPVDQLAEMGREGVRRVAARHRARDEAARLADWFEHYAAKN